MEYIDEMCRKFGHLFPCFLEDMLRGEEEVRHESGDPVWERDDEIISVFLVHGGLHLGELLVDGRMVSKVPTQEGIGIGGARYEVVLATSEHDAYVFSNKVMVYFIFM
jgi:hypothetical protein